MMLVDTTLEGETPHGSLNIQNEFDLVLENVLLLGSFSTIIMGSKTVMRVYMFIFYECYC